MNLLEVSNLKVSFQVEKKEVIAVDNVSFQVKPGETIGVVGESGSGKSVTALAILQLLGKGGQISNGKILFNGNELTQFNKEEVI
jgi:peptide/nickel transport system ATP-binding protein